MFSVFNRSSLVLLALVMATPVFPAIAEPMVPVMTLGSTDFAVKATRFADEVGLLEIADEEMDDILAQAGSLILVDYIGPNELKKHGNAAFPEYTNFSYYRMGLDARMEVNLNMSKLQLGCGGVNDLLTTTPACDIDIDYVSFMGINAAGNAPGAATSPFVMKRPFIELAIKNDNNAATREVVGFRVGAENINGALGLGREYTTNNATNLERGGTCNTVATVGTGVANCHAGINSVSGFLSLELSAAIRARANIMGFITTDLNTCLGRMNPQKYGCGPNSTPFFADAGGTRIDILHVAAAKLNIDSISLNCAWWNWAVCWPAQLFANALINEGYGQLKVDLRQVHYLLTPNTSNFFISSQREPVSWPNYTKTTPPNNLAYDACNPSYSQASPRCSSAYAPAANTGWWLNAPGVKLLNIDPPDRINLPGTLDAGTLLSLLGPEGRLIIEYPKLGLTRPANCYGTSTFC